jgi:uncharacterized protein YgiM (DUF1202 family)
MQRMAIGMRRVGVDSPRLDRRGLLRAGAGVAVSALAAGWRSVPAAARQDAAPIVGGRWIEAADLGLAQRADPSQYVVFATEYPVSAVAPSWGGAGDPAAVVELLWSPDGVTWSEPVWIGATMHNGRPNRDDRVIGNLVATPGATFLQYRTYDSAGNLAPLPEFQLDYIDASGGPSLEQVADPATTPLFGPPPVISRVGWGADESLRFGEDGEEVWPLEYQAVEHVIIHHADTANFNDPILEMRSIYYYHAITHGWGDIGYNYLVDFLGNVYEGRVGGETAIGGHAAGYNAGSCGICLIGRYFTDNITPEMHNAIVWITAWAGRDLDPTGSATFHDIPDLPTICGHRDVNPTTCPGDEFYGQLDTVRLEVRRVVRGRDAPEPPPPEWYPGMQVVTNADGISLRSGPGLDFDVTATVAIGERLTILQGPATNDRIIWYKVAGSSMTGWIAGNLLLPAPPAPGPETPAAPGGGEASATPVTESPPGEPPPDDAVGGGEEPRDDDGKGGDNRRRKDRRQEAWPVFAPGTAAIVAGGPLNLRAAPGLAAAIYSTLSDGAAVTVVSGPADADGIAWYEVATADGRDGWCDGSYLQTI